MGNGRRDVVRYFFIKNFTCCNISQKNSKLHYCTNPQQNKTYHFLMFFYISNAKKEKNKSNLDKIQLNLRILSNEEKIV